MDGEVGEPAFLLAAESPRPRRRCGRARRRRAPRGSARSAARPCRPRRSPRRRCRLASSAIAAIASTVRSIGSPPSCPASSRPSPSRVTSARSTTVVHSPSACRSPMWNLTEFVPTSMTAYRFAPNPTSALSPRAMQTFRRAPRPSSRTAAITRAGSSDFDRDRPSRALLGAYLGALRHAAADRVVLAPLVHLDREQVRRSASTTSSTSWSSVYSVRSSAWASVPSASSTAATSAAASGNVAFITGFHCSSPSSFTVWSCFTSMQTVADLDRGVAAAREQVDLVALLSPLRRRAPRSARRRRRSLAEGAPLPAGNDRVTRGPASPPLRHRALSSRCAKYSSALRVFVCCSPERSMPVRREERARARRRPGTPRRSRSASRARGCASRRGRATSRRRACGPSSSGVKRSLSTKIGPRIDRSSSADPLRHVRGEERPLLLREELAQRELARDGPRDVGRAQRALHRRRADVAAGQRVDLDAEARRPAQLGRQLGRARPAAASPPSRRPCPGSGGRGRRRPACRAPGRACRRRRPGGSAPRADRGRASTTAERWSVSGTVSFSSTLSDSLISASSFVSSSPEKVAGAAVVDRHRDSFRSPDVTGYEASAFALSWSYSAWVIAPLSSSSLPLAICSAPHRSSRPPSGRSCPSRPAPAWVCAACSARPCPSPRRSGR